MPPKTPLREPHEYFDGQLDPFSRGAAVFALHVVVDVVVIVILVRLLLGRIENPPAGLEQEVSSLLAGTIVFALVIYVIAWLVVAAVMHFLSGGSSTAGSFGDALGVAGWAYAPEVITAPATLAFAWYQLSQLHLDGSDTARLVAELETLERVTFHPISIAILLVVTAWSVYILAKGVAATHDVSVDRTLLPAALIGIGSFLLAFV